MANEEGLFEYKVAPGETLGEIALRFKTTIGELQKLNPEIKDPNLIRMDQIIKVPKEKPPGYEEAFSLFKERLYKGYYGLEGAREKMGKELEARFPGVDVWKDVYERIPDYWEKEAFKGMQEPVVSKVPEPKQDVWKETVFNIEKTYKTPFVEKVLEPLTKIFEVQPKEEAAKSAYSLIDVARTVWTGIKETIGAPFQKVDEEVKRIAEERQKAIEEWPEKRAEIAFDWSKWVLKNVPPFSTTKEAYELREFEKARKEYELGEEAYKKAVEAKLKPESVDFEKLRTDPLFLQAFARLKAEDAMKELEGMGVEWQKDETGNAVGFKLPKLETELNELAKQLSERSIPEYESYINKFSQRLLDAVNAVASSAKELNSFLNDPTNSIRFEEAKKKWNEKLEGADELLNIDATLQSYDEMLAAAGRSLEQSDKFLSESVERWKNELDSLLSPKAREIMYAEKRTEEDETFLINEISKLDEDKARRVVELSRLLHGASVFSNTVNKIWDFTQDPDVWPAVREFFATRAGKEPELAKIFDELVKSKNVLESKVIPGLQLDLVKRVSEVKDPEEFDKIAKEIKGSGASAETVDLWLKYIAKAKEAVVTSEKVLKLANDLNQASKMIEEAELRGELEIQKKNSEYYKEWAQILEKGKITGVLKAFNPFSERGRLRLAETIGWRLEPLLNKIEQALSGYDLGVIFDKCVPGVLATLSSIYNYLAMTMPLSYPKGIDKLYPELKDLPIGQQLQILMRYNANPTFGIGPLEKQRQEILKLGTEKNWTTEDIALKYWKLAFDYFRNPRQFIEIEVREDTEIRWDEGALRLGHLRYESVPSPSNFLRLNPHLKGVTVIPKGTKVVVPRYHPLPSFTDMIDDQTKWEFYQNYPNAAQIADFCSNLADPLLYLWGTIKSVAGKGVSTFIKGFPEFEKASFRKIFAIIRRPEWAGKLEHVEDSFDNLARFAIGSTYDPEGPWPGFAKRLITEGVKIRIGDAHLTVLPSLERIRTALFNTLLLKSMPIAGAAEVADFAESMKSQLQPVFVAAEVQNALLKAAEETGDLRGFLSRLIDYAKHGTDPGEGVMDALMELGLTPYDVWKAARKFPNGEMEDLVNHFVQLINLRKEMKVRTMLPYAKEYLAMDPESRAYFMTIWNESADIDGRLRPKEWKKIWKTNDFNEALGKFRGEYVNEIFGYGRPDIDYTKLSEKFSKAEKLFLDVQGKMEEAREIAMSAQTLVYHPSEVALVEVKASEVDKLPQEVAKRLRDNQGGALVKEKRQLKFYYVKEWLSKTQSQVPFMIFSDLIDLRLRGFKEISYGEAGNRFIHTIGSERAAVSSEKVINRALGMDVPAKSVVIKAYEHKGNLLPLSLSDALMSSWMHDFVPKAQKEFPGLIDRLLQIVRKHMEAPEEVFKEIRFSERLKIPISDLAEGRARSPIWEEKVLKVPVRSYNEFFPIIRAWATLELAADMGLWSEMANLGRQLLRAEKLTMEEELLLEIMKLGFKKNEFRWAFRGLFPQFMKILLFEDSLQKPQINLLIKGLKRFGNEAKEQFAKKVIAASEKAGVPKARLVRTERGFWERREFKSYFKPREKAELETEIKKALKTYKIGTSEPIRAEATSVFVKKLFPYVPIERKILTDPEARKKLLDYLSEKITEIMESVEKFENEVTIQNYEAIQKLTKPVGMVAYFSEPGATLMTENELSKFIKTAIAWHNEGYKILIYPTTIRDFQAMSELSKFGIPFEIETPFTRRTAVEKVFDPVTKSWMEKTVDITEQTSISEIKDFIVGTPSLRLAIDPRGWFTDKGLKFLITVKPTTDFRFFATMILSPEFLTAKGIEELPSFLKFTRPGAYLESGLLPFHPLFGQYITIPEKGVSLSTPFAWMERIVTSPEYLTNIGRRELLSKFTFVVPREYTWSKLFSDSRNLRAFLEFLKEIPDGLVKLKTGRIKGLKVLEELAVDKFPTRKLKLGEILSDYRRLMKMSKDKGYLRKVLKDLGIEEDLWKYAEALVDGVLLETDSANLGFLREFMERVNTVKEELITELHVSSLLEKVKWTDPVLYLTFNPGELLNDSGVIRILWSVGKQRPEREIAYFLFNPEHLTEFGQKRLLSLFKFQDKTLDNLFKNAEEAYKWLVSLPESEMRLFIDSNREVIEGYMKGGRTLLSKFRLEDGFELRVDEYGNEIIRPLRPRIEDRKEIQKYILKKTEGRYFGYLDPEIKNSLVADRELKAEDFLDRLANFTRVDQVPEEDVRKLWELGREYENLITKKDDLTKQINSLKSVIGRFERNLHISEMPKLKLLNKEERKRILFLQRARKALRDKLNSIEEELSELEKLKKTIISEKERIENDIEMFTELKTIQEEKRLRILRRLREKAQKSAGKLKSLEKRSDDLASLRDVFDSKLTRYSREYDERVENFWRNRLKPLYKLYKEKQGLLIETENKISEIQFDRRAFYGQRIGLYGPIVKDPALDPLSYLARSKKEQELIPKFLERADVYDATMEIKAAIEQTEETIVKIEDWISKTEAKIKKGIVKEEIEEVVEEVVDTHVYRASGRDVKDFIEADPTGYMEDPWRAEGGIDVWVKTTRKKVKETVSLVELVEEQKRAVYQLKKEVESLKSVLQIVAELRFAAKHHIFFTPEEIILWSKTRVVPQSVAEKFKKLKSLLEHFESSLQPKIAPEIKEALIAGHDFEKVVTIPEQKIEGKSIDYFYKMLPPDNIGDERATIPGIYVRTFPRTDIVDNLKKTFTDLREARIFHVADTTGKLSLYKDLAAEYGIVIEDFSQLSYAARSHLSYLKGVPVPKEEAEAFLRLRDFYLTHFKIAIFGEEFPKPLLATAKLLKDPSAFFRTIKSRAMEVKEILESRYLTPLEAAYIGHYKTLFSDVMIIKKAVALPGPNILYPRTWKAFENLVKLDKEEIKRLIYGAAKFPYAIEKAHFEARYFQILRDLETFLKKSEWIPEKAPFFVNDLKDPQYVLVITVNTNYLSPSAKQAILDIATRQKARILMPSRKFETKGDVLVKNFLKSKGVSFKAVDLEKFHETWKVDPGRFWLFPVGKSFKEPQSKLFYLAMHEPDNRLWKSIDALRKKFHLETLNSLKAWYRDARRLPPDFIQILVNQKFPEGKIPSLRQAVAILTDWVMWSRRLDFKGKWKEVVELIVQQAASDFRKELLRLMPGASKAQLKVIYEKVARKEREIRALLDQLGKYLFEFDREPTVLEKLLKFLNTKVNITEDPLGYQLLAGIPIDEAIPKRNTSFIKDLLQKAYPGFLKAAAIIPFYSKLIFSKTLGKLKTAWVMSVLYYRPAWYARNAAGDAARMVYESKRINYFVEAELQLLAAFSSFAKKMLGDLAGVAVEVRNAIFGLSEELLDEIEKMAGPKWKKWYANKIRSLSKMPGLWKPGEPGWLGHIDQKLWKASKAEAVMSLRRALQEGPMVTPSGELLTEKVLKYLAAGLMGTQDPIILERYFSWLPETTLFQRLKKRLIITHHNILYWAGIQESLRRELLVHDLLFKKAMTLAQTKKEVWKYLFNYSELTLVGRLWRTFFPFYTYNARFLTLFLKEAARLGPAYWRAANYLIYLWSEATKDLPPWMRTKVPLGKGYYWGTSSNLAEILHFFADPLSALQEMALNPNRVILGFGWTPYVTGLIQTATDLKYWDLANEMQERTDWSPAEIEMWIDNNKLKRKKDDDWFNLLMTFCPPIEVARALLNLDASVLVSWRAFLKNSNVRTIMRYFGLNIMKWEDVDQFIYLMFELEPDKRRAFIKQMNSEHPEAWKAVQAEFARIQIAKILRAKDEKELKKAWSDFSKKSVISTYFTLEEKKPGSGKLWLLRAPEAKRLMDEFWAEREITPWSVVSRIKYTEGLIRSRVNALLSLVKRKEVFMRAKILGLPFDLVVGNYDDIRSQFLDELGQLRVHNEKELEALLGKFQKDFHSWDNKDLVELVNKTALRNYHEWLFQKSRAETPEEKSFADKMAKLKAIIPSNIEELPKETQAKIWALYNNFLKKNFSEAEKTRYLSGFPEWYRAYFEKIMEYFKIWENLLAKFDEEGFDFFKEFYALPQWFRDFYFATNPTKAVWYPVARDWMKMLKEIEEIEAKTFVFQKELRKKATDFLWQHENIIRNYWDVDNPGFYDYMKQWSELLLTSEDRPLEYFELFFKMPQEFQDRFFKRNPEKKIYYQFLKRWLSLIKEDQENWIKNRIRTRKASEFFWSPENEEARKLYAKSKKVAPDKTIIDYLKVWDTVMQKTEDAVEDYFELFYQQEDWFINHFFNVHPEKKVYYPVVRNWRKYIEEDKNAYLKTGVNPGEARRYFITNIKNNRNVADAWEKDNPGIIEYLDKWSSIMQETEVNPEKYFELFYKQDEQFRKRFFASHPLKEIYYPTLYKWTLAMKFDEEQRAKGKKSNTAKEYFRLWKDTKVGKAYADDNPIDGHNALEYLNIWSGLWESSETEGKNFFDSFYSTPEWFQEHYFKKHTEAKIYYPFARELFKLPSDEFADYFWNPKFDRERQAWERAKPGTLDYFKFWKTLGLYAKTKRWDLFYDTYFAKENEKYRLMHWAKDPDNEMKYKLMREYYSMPSITWEDRKKKREFLKANPQILAWWKENLSEEDAAVREKVERYYELLDSVPSEGRGKQFLLEYQKARTAAEKYLEDNPEVAIHLQKSPKLYFEEKPAVLGLAKTYHSLLFPYMKEAFLMEHPELKSYFRNLYSPGIRYYIELQDAYFATPKNQRESFLKANPDLQEYWEITKLPWSYFYAPSQFNEYQSSFNKVDRYFKAFIDRDWKKSEIFRKNLPDIYEEPGDSSEDEWFKSKVYNLAMESWIKIAEKNELLGIYFFRQLPSWIRAIYLERHPHQKQLSLFSLGRFIEEPLRIESALFPDLAWASAIKYKYGKNIPFEYRKRVEDIFIKYGVWEDRRNWTKADWQDYYEDRALKLNELNEYDLNNLPLLRSEFNKLIARYPMKPSRMTLRSPRLGEIKPFD